MKKKDPTNELLEREYARTLEAVSMAEAGSEQAKAELNKLVELQKLKINESKVRDETKGKKIDVALKIAELSISIIGIVVPIGVSCFWMARGLEFETKGSYSSKTMGWIRNNIGLFRK